MTRLRTASSLQPLLAPRSIAIVGASDREGSFGRMTLLQTRASGFRGPIYPINPKLREVLGQPCYPSLADLPEPADLVIFAVGNPLIEEQLRQAVAAGSRAGVIFASCYLEDDGPPLLAERIGGIARQAGFALCGANCMGFYNTASATSATWYNTGRLQSGRIGLISHSGTLFLSLAANDPSTTYSLLVSPGQELTVTAADYMDYMLDSGETRVIGLVLETVRDPEGFVAALEKAEAMDVAVAAIKIGRTEQSARFAKSHSGAITGDDAAYEALFERHGVLRCANVNELMATLRLMAMPKRAVPGGIGAVLDSGGARGLVLDLAADYSLPMARIGAATQQKLRETLEYGLEPVNPVDAWGTGHDFERRFADCLLAVTEDDDAGIGILFSDVTIDDDPIGDGLTAAAISVAEKSRKPVFVATHWSRSVGRHNVQTLARHGIPCIEGTELALQAVRHAFAYRDFRDRDCDLPPAAPEAAIVDSWRTRLANGIPLDEAEGMRLLADFGIATPGHVQVSGEADLDDAAERLNWPLVLKTAMPGIHHKSDVGGVRLNLHDATALRQAYGDMAARLGPKALAVEMLRPGVEIALGMVRDEQFGPIVMVAAGGTMIELHRDRRVALPPVNRQGARALIDRLRLRPMLEAHRDRAASDIAALVETVARFSVLIDCLGSELAEMDVNPLIVGTDGAVAADVLVIPRTSAFPAR